jgi:hypothetical protein
MIIHNQSHVILKGLIIFPFILTTEHPCSFTLTLYMCITCTFDIIHSYLFGLNINLHIKKPHNALNPYTQAYTNIAKHSSCKFIACTFTVGVFLSTQP